MRTPRAATARGEDRLVTEAQNLARLQQGQTPLFGGDSGVHIEKGDFGDSLDPRAGQSVRATPSALAGQTPALGQTGLRSIGGVPGTPSVAGTPLRTGGMQHTLTVATEGKACSPIRACLALVWPLGTVVLSIDACSAFWLTFRKSPARALQIGNCF